MFFFTEYMLLYFSLYIYNNKEYTMFSILINPITHTEWAIHTKHHSFPSSPFHNLKQ